MSPPLALALLSLGAILVAADPIHVPLRRVSKSRNLDLNEVAHRVNVRYGFVQHNSTQSSKINGRASSASVPIVNQDVDASYFASIAVGTPPQTFGVILDTGSSDLWLAGSSCTRSCSSEITLFEPTKSSSFQTGNPGFSTSALGAPIEIQYGSGAVSGSLVADTVTMAGFTVPAQRFVDVDTIQGNILSADPRGASGLMGLAFTGLAETGATPLWLALAQNQLSSPEMAFWLARSNNPQQEDVPGGAFTLGGTNSSLFTGSIEFLDMAASPPLFWTLPIANIQVNGKTVNIQKSTMAAIDTGTSLIAGPIEDVTAIWAAVPGSAPSRSSQGFFNFPCSNQVSVSISFGGKMWPISPADMIATQEPDDETLCIGSIFAVEIPAGAATPSWIIGDTFLKNVYSVFRAMPPSIGFAQLSSLTGATPSAPTETGASSASPVGGTGSTTQVETLSSLPSAGTAKSLPPPITGLPEPTPTGLTGLPNDPTVVNGFTGVSTQVGLTGTLPSGADTTSAAVPTTSGNPLSASNSIKASASTSLILGSAFLGLFLL